jgi:hypothetical protein
MKTYMENQQKTPSTDSYQARAGRKSSLIKAVIIGIVFMGASFAGTVYADCPENATDEDWYNITGTPGSPEQRPELAERDRSSREMASNNMDENWYAILGTPGSPEQRSDLKAPRTDRSSETMVASNNLDETFMNLGTPGSFEQQPGFRGRGREIARGVQVC